MTDVVIYGDQPLAQRTELNDQVRQAIEDARAANTRRAYRADWAHFAGWCEEQGEAALPADPATVARYLVAHAKVLKKATLTRRLSGISVAHQLAGLDSPTSDVLVRTTMQGIRRQKVDEQETQKDPAVTQVIRKLVGTFDESSKGIRNRAMLLIGFAGAFRRSELVSLNVQDIKATREGLVVTLRRSKTDQEGQGQVKGIPYGSHIVRTLVTHVWCRWVPHRCRRDRPIR